MITNLQKLRNFFDLIKYENIFEKKLKIVKKIFFRKGWRRFSQTET